MKRELVTVIGRVQGVGLRDAIVALAREFTVTGTVRNLRGERAVEIDVEGEPSALDAFIAQLTPRRLALARIDSLTRHELPPSGHKTFQKAPTL